MVREVLTWKVQTLKDLGMLPLYLSSVFYENFNKVSETCKSGGFLLLVFFDWIYCFNKFSLLPENQETFYEILPEGSKGEWSEQTEEKKAQERN